jgi:hypothetical protein
MFQKRPKMKKIAKNMGQITSWAGIIAPILFVEIFSVEGAFRSGYDPLKMYISALSLGERGWIQITNFVIFGVLLLTFTFRISNEFQTGKASKGGLVLMRILAILFFISGPFVMDPMGTPDTNMSIHGAIHGIAGGIVFLLMPIICIVYLRRFLGNPDWRSFNWITLVLGTIEVAAVLFFTIVSKIPQNPNMFTDWLGLIQRIALIPFMIWLLFFAIELLRRNKVESKI